MHFASIAKIEMRKEKIYEKKKIKKLEIFSSNEKFMKERKKNEKKYIKMCVNI